MNRLLLIFLSTLFITTLFIEAAPKGADKYGMAGCGLGSLIFKENTFVPQTLANTTNIHPYTSMNQSFGISSGTSNCTADGIVKNEKVQEAFVHLNYESLEQEIALGKGEKLDALASLFGCKNNREYFAIMAKNNYNKFFSIQNNTPHKLLASIKVEITKDENLQTSCNL